jgi:glycosyltransferase involved in cell wall biosynthesis
MIYNGIDTEGFSQNQRKPMREKYGVTDETVFLFLSPKFGDERKGGRYFNELMKRLSDTDSKYVIIGNAEGFSLPSDTILPGVVWNEELLAGFYAMADVLVVPSSFETLPTVGLEAVCCGTPVIGFDRGGTKETAPAGHGIFVEYGDMDALEKAARAIVDGSAQLATRDEREAFGKRIFDKAIMAEKYKDLFEAVVKQ